MIRNLVAMAIIAFARALTGVRAFWRYCDPRAAEPRIYFANHTSHCDFLMIWMVLPEALRRLTRPVACAQYWGTGAIRRYICMKVFRAVLIDRTSVKRDRHPITAMINAIDDGKSLVVFPEGTRNTTDTPYLDFKGGLYNFAKARPGVDLVPVWIQNLNRVMPKGELIPVPLLCTVTFGPPMRREVGETKDTFLKRAQGELARLASEDAV